MSEDGLYFETATNVLFEVADARLTRDLTCESDSRSSDIRSWDGLTTFGWADILDWWMASRWTEGRNTGIHTDSASVTSINEAAEYCVNDLTFQSQENDKSNLYTRIALVSGKLVNDICSSIRICMMISVVQKVTVSPWRKSEGLCNWLRWILQRKSPEARCSATRMTMINARLEYKTAT